MVKRINLALQGGGAHGAFTWGALLRLLEDPDIEITAISGTSAGALNGAALKAGLVLAPGEDGQAKARDNLNWLWRQIGAVSDLRLSRWMDALFPGPAIFTRMLENSPFYHFVELSSQVYSPYYQGPFYQNPLRRIVERFHYENVCATVSPALFISATRVRNGKIRVFEQHEITTDVILASACLPTIFQALEIYDETTQQVEAFWDGGYSGNPALFPLFRHDDTSDIVIININPLERAGIPKSPNDIENRINEISFNASLMRELQGLHRIRGLIEEGALKKGSARSPNIHMIADDEIMTALSVATKVVPSPYVLRQLREAGYAAADRFLSDHKADLNSCGTVKLDEMFGEAESIGAD